MRLRIRGRVHAHSLLDSVTPTAQRERVGIVGTRRQEGVGNTNTRANPRAKPEDGGSGGRLAPQAGAGAVPAGKGGGAGEVVCPKGARESNDRRDSLGTQPQPSNPNRSQGATRAPAV